MGYTLEQFSSECHRILAEDPGVEGRKKVCALVQDVLKDEDFVSQASPRRSARAQDPLRGPGT